MNSMKRELQIWYFVLIAIIILLLLHETVILCINIYIGNLNDEELLKAVSTNWYKNFTTYLSNYNAIKTLLFTIPMLLLIISVNKKHYLEKNNSVSPKEESATITLQSDTESTNIKDE